jgi:hypothetical protein
MFARRIALAFTILFLASIFTVGLSRQSVGALSGSDFNAGNIIDDDIFYDSDALTTTQVQNFLNAKVPTCDTNGTVSKSYYYDSNTGKINDSFIDTNNDGINDSTNKWVTTSRATYGARYDVWYKTNIAAAPYTCLKNYKQNTPAMNAESGICGNLLAQSNRTTAQIISDAAAACGISPKVLLVLLQKEQGLVTDTWPWKNQYQKATGFSCPDTAPCDPAYSGFFYQVYYAARQYKLYRANPTTYNYRAGQNNYIYYNPNHSCGGSWVYIENQATAGLYDYTPYQPNAATLKVGMGQTAPCGAYGNKNFWWYFTDWFGSTTIPYIPLQAPRWMETKTDIYKKNPGTGSNIDSVIPAGTQIYFDTKITLGGVAYLRTKHDTEYGFSKGILLSDLAEIPVNYISLQAPRWFELKTNAPKYDPVTGERTTSNVPAGTKIYFSTKFDIGGKTYLRTQHDTTEGGTSAFDITDLNETTVDYVTFLRSRWMEAKVDTSERDLTGTGAIILSLASKTQKYFSYKITINGASYALESLPASGTYTGVPLAELEEIPLDFKPMVSSRWMQIKSDTPKKDPITEENVGAILPAGTQIYFAGKFDVGGKAYLLTQHDFDRNIPYAIPFDTIEEIPVSYTPMAQPRMLELRMDSYKRDPLTGRTIDSLLKAGTQISFADKIEIGGTVYLRTLHDANLDVNKAVPLSDLKEL